MEKEGEEDKHYAASSSSRAERIVVMLVKIALPGSDNCFVAIDIQHDASRNLGMNYRWDCILDRESGIAISIGKYPADRETWVLSDVWESELSLYK